jgi:hypothetical protein
VRSTLARASSISDLIPESSGACAPHPGGDRPSINSFPWRRQASRQSVHLAPDKITFTTDLAQGESSMITVDVRTDDDVSELLCEDGDGPPS